MADDVKVTPGSPGNSNPNPASPAPAAPAAGTEPGVAAVDWAAKYKELEGQYQPLAKYRELFPDTTPEEVKQGVDWALGVYRQVKEGNLVAKGANQAPAAPAPEANLPPWKSQDWDMLPSSTQAERMSDFYDQQLNARIAAKESEFRGVLDNSGKLYGRQQNILLKALEAAQKNPGLDVNTILAKASEAAQLPAEALIDQIVNAARNSPEAEEARVNKLVEERLAQRLQEESNKKLDLISASSRIPRGLASIAKRTVADENKDILRKLAEKGITLQ